MRTSSRSRKPREFFKAGSSKRIQGDAEEEEFESSPKRRRDSKGASKASVTKKIAVGELVSALRDPKCALMQVVNDLESQDIVSSIFQLYLEMSGATVALAKEKVSSSTSLNRQLNDFTENVAKAICKCIADLGEPSKVRKVSHDQLFQFYNILLKKRWSDMVTSYDSCKAFVSNMIMLAKSPLRLARETALRHMEALGSGIFAAVIQIQQALKARVNQLELTLKKSSSEEIEFALKEFLGVLNRRTVRDDEHILLDKEKEAKTKADKLKALAPTPSGAKIDSCLEHALNISRLELMITECFTQLTVQCSKDICENVRLACLSLIGTWASARPSMYFESSEGYLLQFTKDPFPIVRKAACEIIGSLVSQEGVNDKSKKSCSKRIVAEIKKYLLKDREPSVICAAIGVLNIMKSGGAFPKINEQDIKSCIFYDGEDMKQVRATAAKFVTLSHSLEIGLDETNSDDSSAVARSRLKLAHFIEMLQEMENGDSCLTPELMLLVVDAFWEIKECDFLKNWEAYSSLLQSYGENNVVGYCKAQIVACLFAASSKVAERDTYSKLKSKKEQKILLEEQTNLLGSLHRVLGRSLQTLTTLFVADRGVLRSVIQLHRCFYLKNCASSSDVATAEKMVQTLSEVLLKVDDPVVTLEIADILVYHFEKVANQPLVLSETIKRIGERMTDSMGMIRDSEHTVQESLTSIMNACRRLNCLSRSSSDLALQLMEIDFTELRGSVVVLIREYQDSYEDLVATMFVEVTTLLQVLLSWSMHFLTESESALQLERTVLFKGIVVSLLEIECKESIRRSLIPVFNDVRLLCTPKLGNDSQLVYEPSVRTQMFFNRQAQLSLSHESEYDVIFSNRDLMPALRTILFATADVDDAANLFCFFVLQEFPDGDPESANQKLALFLNTSLKESSAINTALLHIMILRVGFNMLLEKNMTGHENIEKLSRIGQLLSRSLCSGKSKACPDGVGNVITKAMPAEMAYAIAGDHLYPYLSVLSTYAGILKPSLKTELKQTWEDISNESSSEYHIAFENSLDGKPIKPAKRKAVDETMREAEKNIMQSDDGESIDSSQHDLEDMIVDDAQIAEMEFKTEYKRKKK